MQKSLLYILFIVISIILMNACQEDNFDGSSDIQLEFSLDTLKFDTVFTQLGSATRTIKAYNPHSRPIMISEVYLEEQANSKFRINVDGYAVDSGDKALEIPVAANDSIYIFVEVTIDPDAPLSISPFVLHENLIFETNGNNQNVVLEAFGQNANYIPSQFSGGTINLLTCDMGMEIWDDPKPYVIYGVLVVDSCEIVLPAGTDIYVHGGIVNLQDGTIYNDGIWFFGSESKLTVNGTVNQPVTIQGDRLEEDFQEVKGQWGGIRLGTGNNTHTIQHAIIKNSIVGLRVDSMATLEMSHTQIRNTSNSGLLGVHANVQATNCLFADNGGHSVQLEFGGNYQLDYCTLSNFGTDASTFKVSNTLCLDEFCSACLGNDLNAQLRNCIIVGSRSDELSFFDRQCADGDAFNVSFENCIVRVDELLEDYPDFFSVNCINNSCFQYNSGDDLFEDYFDGDYHLDSLSIANDKGISLSNVFVDLDEVARDGLTPDVGCYESLYD